MTERLVALDASAVLTAVLKQPRAGGVEKLLPVGVIPAPNMTEVLNVAPQRGYQNTPENLYAALLDTGLDVEPFTEEDVVRAAELLTASRAHPVTGEPSREVTRSASPLLSASTCPSPEGTPTGPPSMCELRCTSSR